MIPASQEHLELVILQPRHGQQNLVLSDGRRGGVVARYS